MLLAAAPVLLIWSCGHDVAPTSAFQNPDDIPLPANFLALPTQLGVQVTWEAEPSIFAIIDGWFLYRAVITEGTADTVFSALTEDIILDLRYDDDDVTSGTIYAYHIRSVTPAGLLSRPSFPSIVLVDFEPPSPPPGIEAEAVSGDSCDFPPCAPFVRITWSASPEADVATYNLFRLPPFSAGPLVNLPFLQFEDFDIEPCITYRYYVTAIDLTENESAPSAAVSARYIPDPDLCLR